MGCDNEMVYAWEWWRRGLSENAIYVAVAEGLDSGCKTTLPWTAKLNGIKWNIGVKKEMGEESSYKSEEFHPFEAVRRGLVKLHGEDERDHLHIVLKQCGALQ